MKRLTKVVLSILALSGLEIYFMNFMRPALKSLTPVAAHKSHVIDTGGKAADHLLYVYKNKKYVWIHAKWYHYNPQHVYYINGTPTLFIHNRNRPDYTLKTPDAGTLVWDRLAIANLNKMMADNPLKIYSPEGMKKLVDAAHGLQHETQAQADEIDRQTDN